MKLLLLASIFVSTGSLLAQGPHHGRPVGHVHPGRPFAHGVYYAGHAPPQWAHRYYDARYQTTLYFDPHVRAHYYWCQPAGRFYPVSYNPYGTYRWNGPSSPSFAGPKRPGGAPTMQPQGPGGAPQPQGPGLAPKTQQPTFNVKSPTNPNGPTAKVQTPTNPNGPTAKVQTPNPTGPMLAPPPLFSPSTTPAPSGVVPPQALAPTQKINPIEPSNPDR